MLAVALFCPLKDAKGDIAGAAGDIKISFAEPWRQLIDKTFLPQAVDAAAHQIVHQIVAIGDVIEYAPDQPGLILALPAAILGANRVGVRRLISGLAAHSNYPLDPPGTIA